MKLYFNNRFFYPDFSATSQMLTDLATALAGDHDVTVLTSRALYNDPLAKLARRDEYQGVEILRLNSTRMGRATLAGRLLDYASFYLRVFVFLLRYVRKGDLVVLKTDPPLLSLMNTAAVRLRGGRVVNWLQDLFPEITIELGAFPRNRLLAGPLTWWRNQVAGLPARYCQRRWLSLTGYSEALDGSRRLSIQCRSPGDPRRAHRTPKTRHP